MKQFILAIFLVFLATNVFAAPGSTWCSKNINDQPLLDTCKTSTINASGTEVLDLKSVGFGLVGGDDTNKNSVGYFKMVAGESTPLQEYQVYSGWLYSFADNVFTKTRQVIMNYDNLTLPEFKWQKYWEFYNEHVTPPRTEDCVYSGFVIPQTARVLMVEAIAAGKSLTYEVYSEATGIPAYFSRTAVQAQGILDYCLDAINTTNANMRIKADAIMACTDGDCVNAITW